MNRRSFHRDLYKNDYSRMLSRPIIALGFSLVCLPTLLSSCREMCESPGLYATFYITDKVTGKPYYQVSQDSPDSLRIYQDEYPSNSTVKPRSIEKIYKTKQSLSFGQIDLYGMEKGTFYFYFNKNDIDTLVLTAIVTQKSTPCIYEQSFITTTYNGRPLKTINSDTTGGSIDFYLLK